MKKEEVPQDPDVVNAGLRKDVYYALDENGQFVQVFSSGWEAKNTVILQAWEGIHAEAEQALREVQAGLKSPLYYYMVRAQMDVNLLSRYTGFPKRKVRNHCTPGGYSLISAKEKEAYAKVLMLEPDTLDNLPDV